MARAFSQQHGRRLLAVHRKCVCERASGIQSSWSCFQEASNSQWVLKTRLQFPSKSYLCQHHKKIGNLRNNKKLAICRGQSAQTIKDSPLSKACCYNQPGSSMDGCSNRSCPHPISSLAKRLCSDGQEQLCHLRESEEPGSA